MSSSVFGKLVETNFLHDRHLSYLVGPLSINNARHSVGRVLHTVSL